MDTKTVLKIISLLISTLPERRSRQSGPPVDDGTVHGPSFNRETSNANQPFKEMIKPTYYTASVDSNSMAGQVSHQVIKSQARRDRSCALPRALTPLEALISVFRHMNGHDPKLVAKRLVADRFWKYAEKYQ